MADTKKLSFGIKTTQYVPYADILRVWLEAEDVPTIEHAWLFDHPMPIGRAAPNGPCLDGWTTLAALAGQTKRLRLGLMVASNTNQTPQWLAKRVATVDIISQGRLEFGFGAGGVEREHTAYGTDYFKPAERVRRFGEACEIIKRMWTEDAVEYDGEYYQLTETYCEPKPVQKPTPPFVLGGAGEQLTLGIVAEHADVWNFPGLPGSPLAAQEFAHKSQVLDEHCAEIGRDPATIVRSVQIIFDPREDPAKTRQEVLDLHAAGATHFVLGPRVPLEGVAHWLSKEIIEPVMAQVG